MKGQQEEANGWPSLETQPWELGRFYLGTWHPTHRDDRGVVLKNVKRDLGYFLHLRKWL